MVQTDMEWWEHIRARGRGWFVFREGILRHGTQVGFWLTLFAMFVSIINGNFPSILGLVIAWVMLAVGFGSLIGVVLWNQHEKDYQKQKRIVRTEDSRTD